MYVSSSMSRYSRQASAKDNAASISRFTGRQYRSEAFQTFSQEKIHSWSKQDLRYQAVISGIPTAKVANTSDLQVRGSPLTCASLSCSNMN